MSEIVKLPKHLQAYKKEIVPQEKTMSDIYDWLSTRFALRELSEMEIAQKHAIECETFLYNCKSITDSDNLKIRVFEIEEKSTYYFKKQKGNMLWVEESFKIFDCTSNRLFREMTIEKGISQYDYDNNTVNLVEYITICFNLHLE